MIKNQPQNLNQVLNKFQSQNLNQTPAPNLHKNSVSKFQPSFKLANIDAPVRLLHWQALSKHPNSTKQSQSLTNIDNDRIRWKRMEGPGKLFLNCLGFAKVSLFLCHSKIVWWLGWVWRRNRNGLEKWLLFPAVPRGEPDNIKKCEKYWDEKKSWSTRVYFGSSL